MTKLIKVVKYNWKKYYFGFLTGIFSGAAMLVSIVFYILQDYKISASAFMFIIIINLFNFLLNISNIREVYWIKKQSGNIT